MPSKVLKVLYFLTRLCDTVPDKPMGRSGTNFFFQKSRHASLPLLNEVQGLVTFSPAGQVLWSCMCSTSNGPRLNPVKFRAQWGLGIGKAIKNRKFFCRRFNSKKPTQVELKLLVGENGSRGQHISCVHGGVEGHRGRGGS